MKTKKLFLPLFCLSFLLMSCGKVKKVSKIISPQSSIRLAYYMKCVDEGSAVVYHVKQDQLDDKLIECFVLEDGTTYYFYPAKGYEFV